MTPQTIVRSSAPCTSPFSVFPLHVAPLPCIPFELNLLSAHWLNLIPRPPHSLTTAPAYSEIPDPLSDMAQRATRAFRTERVCRRAGRRPCGRHEAVASFLLSMPRLLKMVAGVVLGSLSHGHDDGRTAWVGVVAFQHDTLHTRRHTTHQRPLSQPALPAALAASTAPTSTTHHV